MKSIIWFRDNLRILDNPSLLKACKHEKVIGLYCFDPRHFKIGPFGFKKTEKFRAQFLIETIVQLKKNLKALHIELLVYHKKPEDILPEIIERHGVKTIYLQKEWTSEESKVLNATRLKLSNRVDFVESYDQFLFHPEDIPYDDLNNLPEIFTAFRKKCERYSTVRPSKPKPISKSVSNLISNNTEVPTLENLGFVDFKMDTRTAFPFKGGESNALKRVDEYFWETKSLATYKQTRNGLVGNNYSSKFSAWLSNGSISPRLIYWEIKKFEKEIKKNQDTYWLIFELIWRDYFKYISQKHGNKIFKIGGILNKEYHWDTNQKILDNWIKGTTSELFINANMIELLETGWMSNRGRQNVASYWSKELKQDWRIGAAYFESLLIDYDVHSNWGNWIYVSGVGNDPRDRKFNIKRQAEIYDANGIFQKLWLQ